MLRVGLTGGIGSGKSEVARRLAARGALVVDSDELAREVVAPGTPGLAAVVAEFGPEILAAEGALDRPKLAARVFADDDARARLNAIVHPLVGAAALERVQKAPADAIVVHDVPLLVELKMAPAFDAVVVVEAPREVRIERLRQRRGMSPADAEARIAAQASDDERRAVATYVIVNDGDLAALDSAVQRVWEALVVLRDGVAGHRGDTVR